jgi:hypothetical protein
LPIVDFNQFHTWPPILPWAGAEAAGDGPALEISVESCSHACAGRAAHGAHDGRHARVSGILITRFAVRASFPYSAAVAFLVYCRRILLQKNRLAGMSAR